MLYKLDIIDYFEKSENNLSCKQVADPLELTAMMQWIHCKYDKTLSMYTHVFQKTVSEQFCYFF